MVFKIPFIFSNELLAVIFLFSCKKDEGKEQSLRVQVQIRFYTGKG